MESEGGRMSSFTPGPWSYESSLGLILSNEGKVIADPIQGAADACLIAAAPDMLALIPELAAYVTNELIRLKDLGADFEKEREAARATLERANALLARINGQK